MAYKASVLTAHFLSCFLKYSLILPDTNFLCIVAEEHCKAAYIAFLADVHKALKLKFSFLMWREKLR